MKTTAVRFGEIFNVSTNQRMKTQDIQQACEEALPDTPHKVVYRMEGGGVQHYLIFNGPKQDTLNLYYDAENKACRDMHQALGNLDPTKVEDAKISWQPWPRQITLEQIAVASYYLESRLSGKIGSGNKIDFENAPSLRQYFVRKTTFNDPKAAREAMGLSSGPQKQQ
jgi:hypothetical protein